MSVPIAQTRAPAGTLAVALGHASRPLQRDFATLCTRIGPARIVRVASGPEVADAVTASGADRVVLYLPLSVLLDALSTLVESPDVLPELIAVVPVSRRSLRRLPPAVGLLDWCVAPTRFGERALRAAWPEPVEGDGEGATQTRFATLSPGADLLTYGPLTDPHAPHMLGLRRARARRALWPDVAGSALGLWVLHASPADPKARLDLTLQGFARFAQQAPSSTRLVLNARRSDLAPHRWTLDALAPHLVFAQPEQGPRLSPSQLNLLYNACEVGVSTSGPCAWSQPVVDHAATGAVQVLPDHTCFSEAWTGAGRLLHVAQGVPVDPGELADVLRGLARDPVGRQRAGLACMAAARSMGSDRTAWARVLGQVDPAPL